MGRVGKHMTFPVRVELTRIQEQILYLGEDSLKRCWDRKWAREGWAYKACVEKLPLWAAGAQILQATVGGGTDPASQFPHVKGEFAELCPPTHLLLAGSPLWEH